MVMVTVWVKSMATRDRFCRPWLSVALTVFLLRFSWRRTRPDPREGVGEGVGEGVPPGLSARLTVTYPTSDAYRAGVAICRGAMPGRDGRLLGRYEEQTMDFVSSQCASRSLLRTPLAAARHRETG